MNYTQINLEAVDTLLEVADNDPAFLFELQALYVKQFREKAPEIENLAAAGEFGKIAGLLHMIKSSSGNLGALDFQMLCARIEKLSKPENEKLFKDALPHFLAQYRAVTEEIQRVYSAVPGKAA